MVFIATNSIHPPATNEYATFTLPALIVADVFGYTFNALAPPLRITIRYPAIAVGNNTPVLAAVVVTLLIEVVSAVAVP